MLFTGRDGSTVFSDIPGSGGLGSTFILSIKYRFYWIFLWHGDDAVDTIFWVASPDGTEIRVAASAMCSLSKR